MQSYKSHLLLNFIFIEDLRVGEKLKLNNLIVESNQKVFFALKNYLSHNGNYNNRILNIFLDT